MKKLIAVLLACILLAAMIFVTGCDGGSAGEDVVPQTYIVTFIADGKIVGKISFTEGDTSVTEPEIPHKDCCVGEWESYTLGNGDITVNAVYSEPHAFLNKIDAITPKCNEKGNAEYFICNDCGKYFSDDKGKTEIIDKENVVLNEVNCSYVKGYCEWCCKRKISEGLEYLLSYDESYYTVTGIGTCTDAEVGIPDEYNGKPVKAIGGWAFLLSNSLTSVTIPNSVTSIGKDAFFGCSSLESITVAEGNSKYHSSGNCLIETESKTLILGCKNSVIPNDGSVTSIGDSAFYNCSSLTSITIPDSVTSIGSYAFSSCNRLTSITIPDSVTSIGSYVFYNCSKLTSITIPDGVTSIGSSAFLYCSSLTSITIPDSVTSIGDHAFLYCSSLASVTIPDSVTSIGDRAFYNCRSLTSVTIGNSVTSIGNQAFSGCYKLVEVYNLSSLDITAGASSNGYVGYYVLDVYTDINTPSKLWTNSDGYTFYENGDACYLMRYTGGDTELTLPNSCNGKNYAIYQNAFSWCGSFTSITIPNNVTSIGGSAFRFCGSLTSITILNGVTSIGDYAFYYCSSLTSVTIGNSVTRIGDYAFGGCSSLTSVTIPNSVTSIGNSAFSWCNKLVEVYNLSSLDITAGSSSNGQVGYYALDVYTDINTPSELWTNSDGYIFYEDGDTCYLIEYTGDDTELTLPDNCNGKNYAINKYAFCGCNNLTSITIHDGVTSIGICAFGSCSNLKSITIPNSITSVEDYAFSVCSSLTIINYIGSEEEWYAINKGNNWNYNTGDYTINYNYTEE